MAWEMILLYLFRLYYPALYYASVHAAEFFWRSVLSFAYLVFRTTTCPRQKSSDGTFFYFFLISLRAHGGTEPYVALHDTVTLYISLSCSFVCFLSLPLSDGTYIVLISWF